jgi:hypothetical protein
MQFCGGSFSAWSRIVTGSSWMAAALSGWEMPGRLWRKTLGVQDARRAALGARRRNWGVMVVRRGVLCAGRTGMRSLRVVDVRGAVLGARGRSKGVLDVRRAAMGARRRSWSVPGVTRGWRLASRNPCGQSVTSCCREAGRVSEGPRDREEGSKEQQ